MDYGLMDDYKQEPVMAREIYNEENLNGINDDYVKFLRLWSALYRKKRQWYFSFYQSTWFFG